MRYHAPCGVLFFKRSAMLRYLTAGESHGKALVAIVEGVPAGLELTAEYINTQLARRQQGYGRGGRQKIEKDRVEILSGVRLGKTLGSPIALMVKNRDWENWKDVMKPEKGRVSALTHPRPGHADLPGAMKYLTKDVRNILERSSARETAARVAACTVARRLLEEFGIQIYSWVVEIGGVRYSPEEGLSPQKLFELAEASETRCPDPEITEKMKRRIDRARRDGDSLGGTFEVVATGMPPGVGSHVHWDRKLDARLAAALMSIQAIKGVEVGEGFGFASLPGSKAHDEIFYSKNRGYYRKTNHAGGIEGGMTNGEPVVLRAVMKPIPTLMKPLRSVDMVTKKEHLAAVERSDVCAVPAASVVAEAVVSLVFAGALLEKFGGDSLKEIKRNLRGYMSELKRF